MRYAPQIVIAVNDISTFISSVRLSSTLLMSNHARAPGYLVCSLGLGALMKRGFLFGLSSVFFFVALIGFANFVGIGKIAMLRGTFKALILILVFSLLAFVAGRAGMAVPRDRSRLRNEVLGHFIAVLLFTVWVRAGGMFGLLVLP
jgi:hypothetical protein